MPSTANMPSEAEMRKKTCTKCSTEKPIAQFNYRNKKKNLRQSWCRTCQHSAKGVTPVHASDDQVQSEFARLGVRIPSLNDPIAAMAAGAADQVAGPMPPARMPRTLSRVLSKPAPAAEPMPMRESALLMLADKLAAETERRAVAESKIQALAEQNTLLKKQLSELRRVPELEEEMKRQVENGKVWQQLAENQDQDMAALKLQLDALAAENESLKKAPKVVAITNDTLTPAERERVGPLLNPVGS